MADDNAKVKAWLFKLLAELELKRVVEATNTDGQEHGRVTISIKFEEVENW